MDQSRADDLASLRAEYDARFAAHEAKITRLERRRRVPRRALPLILAALLVALVPLATLAATPFTDLTGGPHDGNIDAIFNAGITKGCDATSYCPTGNVTREEMASFLARTAGLGGNPPIANALTAQTAQSAVSAQTATSATNATTAQNAVNAQAATNATNAVNATNATNAAQLGGRPAAEYARAAQIVPHVYFFNGTNALPANVGSFTAVGTRVLVLLSGSGYRPSDIGKVGITVNLSGPGDGFGFGADAYTNEPQSHKAVVTGMQTRAIVPGVTYTVQFNKFSDTTLNKDDTITCTVLELP